MSSLRLLPLLFPFVLIYAACTPGEGEELPDWALGPFEKVDSLNPILQPDTSSRFRCPVRGTVVRWEGKDVFNPAAIVREGQVHLLYRAEDFVGRHHGTSRIGLALSTDALHFERLPQPVFYPDSNALLPLEWEGGVEDPRIVEMPEGGYLMTYTAYDGRTARLLFATSPDLRSWTRRGPVLADEKHRDTWSKSGAIVCRRESERLVATPLQGKYWMFFGDTDCFAATSPDLLHWTPLEDENGQLKPVFGPRPGKFDSRLVEPGPPPLLTERGILLLYNSMNLDEGGDPTLPPGTYTAGQILLDPKDPTRVLERLEQPFFRPEKDYEISGQVNRVVFIEALVPFQGRWWLYYGTADSKIAVARGPAFYSAGE
ncbi:MAG: glycosidase [Bacteroidetes bacterium]|nr:MAG: glycosidase [Bacteroidota bacterium]